MSEYNQIEESQTGQPGDGMAELLDDLSNRVSDTVENIAELADEAEEISSEIKSLLEDLRFVQNRLGPPVGNNLEPLIDQLEGVQRELETAVWTMDCVTEGLPEETDLLQISEAPLENVEFD